MANIWKFEIEMEGNKPDVVRIGTWQECFSKLLVEFADYAKHLFESYQDDPENRDLMLGRMADGFRHIDLYRKFDADFERTAVGITFRIKQTEA
jgi:hypothetical protein